MLVEIRLKASEVVDCTEEELGEFITEKLERYEWRQEVEDLLADYLVFGLGRESALFELHISHCVAIMEIHNLTLPKSSN